MQCQNLYLKGCSIFMPMQMSTIPTEDEVAESKVAAKAVSVNVDNKAMRCYQ